MPAHLSINHGPHSRVTVHQYPELGKAPVLSISSPETHFALSAGDRGGLSALDVQFARELAKAAGEYLAACEEIRAVHEVLAERELHGARRGDLYEVPA